MIELIECCHYKSPLITKCFDALQNRFTFIINSYFAGYIFWDKMDSSLNVIFITWPGRNYLMSIKHLSPNNQKMFNDSGKNVIKFNLNK
jgi:hypothetical protein